MNKRLENMLYQNEVAISTWFNSINHWQGVSLDSSKVAEDEYINALNNVINSLGEMMRLFASYGKFKDSWKPPTFKTHPMGEITVNIESQKTGLIFTIGLGFEGLFFQSYLLYGNHLKNMNDKFWKHFLELSEYGSFEFKENASYRSKEQSHLFRTYKGNIYRLMRNYILSQFEEEYEDLDLGWLFTKWHSDTPFQQVVAYGCQTFRLMYKINHSLWKVEYSKSNRR